MSRIGKIARLPKAVREELNRRLEDGEQQNRLVEWLNGRPDVQEMLKAHYDGRAINEPNLTAWVQGGYEDWRRQEESLNAAERMVEESRALDEMCDGRGLADRAADMAALAIGEQLMAVRRMENGDEKRRAVLKLVRGLVRLRNSDRACERGQREAAQAARAAEVHEDWAERMRRRAHADAPPPPSLWRAGSGQEIDVRKKMTAVIAAMSDEQIAESLSRSGYLPGVELLGKKRVWWTEEDQALEESEEDADEGEDYEDYDDEEEAEAEDEGEEEEDSGQVTGDSGHADRPETSTSMSTSTSTNGPVRQGSGQTQRLGAAGPSILPPEGGTTNDRRPGDGALIEP